MPRLFFVERALIAGSVSPARRDAEVRRALVTFLNEIDLEKRARPTYW